MTEPPPPPAWVAWRRRDEKRARWRPLGGAATEAGAWALVWKAINESGLGHYSSCVLRTGEKP